MRLEGGWQIGQIIRGDMDTFDRLVDKVMDKVILGTEIVHRIVAELRFQILYASKPYRVHFLFFVLGWAVADIIRILF